MIYPTPLMDDDGKPREEILTVLDVCKHLKITRKTVVKLFANYPGVIDLGTPEAMHKQQYRILRIPRHVYDRRLRDLSA